MLLREITVYELYLCFFRSVIRIDHNRSDYVGVLRIDVWTEGIILFVDILVGPTEPIYNRIEIIDI